MLRAQGPWFLVPITDISKWAHKMVMDRARHLDTKRNARGEGKHDLEQGFFLRPPGSCYWGFLLKAPVALSFFHVLLGRASEGPTLSRRVCGTCV